MKTKTSKQIRHQHLTSSRCNISISVDTGPLKELNTAPGEDCCIQLYRCTGSESSSGVDGSVYKGTNGENLMHISRGEGSWAVAARCDGPRWIEGSSVAENTFWEMGIQVLDEKNRV
jgi:hypothetical protein